MTDMTAPERSISVFNVLKTEWELYALNDSDDASGRVSIASTDGKMTITIRFPSLNTAGVNQLRDEPRDDGLVISVDDCVNNAEHTCDCRVINVGPSSVSGDGGRIRQSAVTAPGARPLEAAAAIGAIAVAVIAITSVLHWWRRRSPAGVDLEWVDDVLVV